MGHLTFTRHRAFMPQNLAREKCDCWLLFKSDTKPEMHAYLLYNEHGPWHCVGSSCDLHHSASSPVLSTAPDSISSKVQILGKT